MTFKLSFMWTIWNVSFYIRKGNHKITKCSENFRDDNQDSHTNSKDNVQFLTQNSKLFDINIPEICFELMLVTSPKCRQQFKMSTGTYFMVSW